MAKGIPKMIPGDRSGAMLATVASLTSPNHLSCIAMINAITITSRRTIIPTVAKNINVIAWEAAGSGPATW